MFEKIIKNKLVILNNKLKQKLFCDFAPLRENMINIQFSYCILFSL